MATLRDLPCRHRGSKAGEVDCLICGTAGRRMVVYDCTLHGACTLGKYKTGRAKERICLVCDDRNLLNESSGSLGDNLTDAKTPPAFVDGAAQSTMRAYPPPTPALLGAFFRNVEAKAVAEAKIPESHHWQAWQEQDSRWVPGYIQPGWVSDCPQFDPLPGEVITCPAFPLAEFEVPKSAAGDTVDVVIPLGGGSKNGDSELRYCLRSVERNVTGLGRVWIVGHRPAWLRVSDRIRHLPAMDANRIKDTNILAKVELVCQQEELTPRFVFINDDQAILRPLAWTHFGPYYWDNLAGRSAAGANRWRRRLLATRDWLAKRKQTTWHYETHSPAVIERARFLELAEKHRGAWGEKDGVTVLAWYCNLVAGNRGKPMGDRKATAERKLTDDEARRLVAGRWFLGYNDAGFGGEGSGLRMVLEEMFSERSEGEGAETKIKVLANIPTLSVIVPTIGRPELRRTLESIKGQRLVDGDEVILVQDGPEEEGVRKVFEEVGLPGRYAGLDRHYGDIGATPRNRGMEIASRDYLVFSDDDDVYRYGAFDSIRREAVRHPGRPLMFRNKVTAWGGRVRWADKTIRPHNVGTPMFAVPNDAGRLAQWPRHRGNDYGFIFDTLAKWPTGSVVWCPEILQDYLEPHSTAWRPIKRNLLYHIYPVASNKEWRLNVKRLLRYWDVFNGRKLIGIVCDDKTATAEEVQAAFDDDSIEWLVTANDPHLGESLTFSEGLRRLRTIDPDEATFYAHAKGVVMTCGLRDARNDTERLRLTFSVRTWRNLMYEHCLRPKNCNLDRVLRTKAAAGCLRRVGRDVGRARRGPGDAISYWFFPGTFFWFNHLYYFGHNCAVTLRENRWGPEYHLGTMFPESDSHDFLPCPRGTIRFYTMTAEEWARIASLPD